jgi:glycosyltransferase involved in cell wall biosynthesis
MSCRQTIDSIVEENVKILFISRAYPPIVGGIENHNFALSQWLPQHIETKTLANRFGKKLLPLFLPFAVIYALIFMTRRDTLLLGDGVLGIVGWFIKAFYRDRRRVVCILHGLDLTYPLPLYQKLWVKRFIPACDQLIAVGNETIKTGISHGLAESKFIFIPNGVDTEKFAPKNIPLSSLATLLKINIKGKHILYSAGRLVKRKGVAWFIREVLPSLPKNTLYVVSGTGPDLDNIKNSVRDTSMEKRVFILGFVPEDIRELLLNTCDIFIQANIPVSGDMEGFGLVVLEAASTGIPVIASRLEGLKDAIHDNENGFLAGPEQAESYRHIILSLLEDNLTRKNFGKKAREYTKIHFHWQSISKQYAEACSTHLKPEQYKISNK